MNLLFASSGICIENVLVKIYFLPSIDFVNHKVYHQYCSFLHWSVRFSGNSFGKRYKIEVQIYFLLMDNIPLVLFI